MTQLLSLLSAARVALCLYALSVVFKQLEPAFPHFTATMEALSAAAFQLGLLCTHPGLATQALSMTFKTPEVKA